jgi:hypothetical protein
MNASSWQLERVSKSIFDLHVYTIIGMGYILAIEKCST